MQDRSADLSAEQVEMLRRRIGDLGVATEHAIAVYIPLLYGEAYEERGSGTSAAIRPYAGSQSDSMNCRA